MRRIALFSDVHADLGALDAVLADIEREGVGETYCLGDLLGYGPDPAGVIARMRERGIPTVRGNYDDGIGNRRGECGCYYATEQARIAGEEAFALTDAVLSDWDHGWLAALPDEIRFDHGGTRVLLAHGSPRKPKDGDPRPGWMELVLGSKEEVSVRASKDDARAIVARTAVWAGTVVHRVDRLEVDATD